jgi:hyperosmotically inducible protein
MPDGRPFQFSGPRRLIVSKKLISQWVSILQTAEGILRIVRVEPEHYSPITSEDNSMKTIAVVALAVIGAIGAPALYAADSDAAYPGMYVKDSAITTKVKTKLVAKEPTTLTNVKVNTDRDGIVWLSGTAPTKEASDRAETIAKETDGVRGVHNNIVVAP